MTENNQIDINLENKKQMIFTRPYMKYLKMLIV